MNGPASSHGAVLSEARRQRELLIRYSNSFRDITRLDFDTSAENGIPSDYVPRLSDDASLTAFAQLACLRLGANRAMISLIDGERQHILAEATPDVYLRAGSYGGSDASSSLWLGNVSIPRTSGICEQVLSLSPTVPYAPEDAVIIINDLLQNTAYAQRTYVYGKPHLRFYAGVALLSPKGAVVGALCVFDDKPRDGLLEEEVLHLRDLSATIMEYLESYSIKDQYRRGEKLTRALLSFNDGASAVSPFESEASVPDVPPSQAGRVPSVPSSHAQGRAARHGNVKTLQQSILPAQSRSMFARAASIICASSDLDGVLILDASVAGISDTRQGKVSNYRVSDDETTTSDGDTTSQKADSSPDEDEDPIFGGRPTRERSSVSGKQCHVLAFATPEDPNCDPSGPEDSLSFAEADLAKLFRTFPKGRIFNTTSDGELVSGADDSDASGSGSAAPNDTTRMQRVPTGGQERILKAIQSLAPEASSTAFVPLWDYERSRWFAGCLCWSKRPDRQLSRRLDLAYIKVFGHSIMTELSRLDALASDHAKTSFVASISHELRSPLHGILGTLEFLRDTPLDSFQASMLNSLDACGNTLLDTINHVLDYAKITGSQQHNVSSKRLKGSKGVRLSSKPLRKGKLDTGPPKEPAFDLAFVTEEVVEAVFSAQSYLVVTGETPDVTSESGRAYSTTSADSMSSNDGERRRRDRFVVLDIAKGKDWSHHLPVASWRRIVMNLFGNALKYTGAGHIHISLKSTPSEPGPESGQTVVLTMTDTGRGMSAQFLANRAFQPFSQENPLAAGTGLGLSIVRNIIETIGGKIDINSDLVSGTQVQVKLALPPLDRVNLQPQRTRFLEMVDRLKGRRVCILHRKNIADTTSPDMLRNREGLERFVVAMVGAMRDHLGMHVVQTETWESNDTDLVICPEPSFNYLASIRQKRSTATGAPAPVTIFVAMDPLEAATLRTDARVMNKASVVEIMTQP
jgi:signal transduction histidine kinase/GAF domain-containing protein